MEQSQIVNPQVKAEFGPIFSTLLSESIRYDPAIHSKLCINGKLDEADMNTLFPELPESTFIKFKGNIKETTLFKKTLGYLKQTAVNHFLTKENIKAQIHEKLNKYCPNCVFNCDQAQTPMPMQQATPLLQTSSSLPASQQPELTPLNRYSLPTFPTTSSSSQNPPLQQRPVSLPTPTQMQMLSQPTLTYAGKLQAYRNSLPQMSDENWGIHVGNMISYDGSNWLDKMQQQRSQQQQKSKNPFSSRGGGPCEDVKKQELIDCIANGLLTSISKKLSLAGGRVRRVRRTYKKSQQRQQKQTRKNTKQLRNKKRSIV